MPALPNANYTGKSVAASASIVLVTGSVTPQMVLPPNSLRTGAHFFNDSNQTVSLAAHFSANTSFCTLRIPASSSMQVPLVPYWGPWAAIWQTVPTTGNLLVTEFT